MGVFVSHATFVIVRDLRGIPAHAFCLRAEHARKRQRTRCHPERAVLEDILVRVGERETVRWPTPEGVDHRSRAHDAASLPGPPAGRLRPKNRRERYAGMIPSSQDAA